MIDVEYCENRKAEILANHINRCHNMKLDEEEEKEIKSLNEYIKFLKEQEHV